MVKLPRVFILSTFFDPFMSGAEYCAEAIAERAGGGAEFEFTIVTGRFSLALPRLERRQRYTIRRLGIGQATIDKWLFPLLAPLFVWYHRPTIVHAIMESYAGVALLIIARCLRDIPTILTLQSGDLDEKIAHGFLFHWLWSRIHTAPAYITAISAVLVTRARALGATNIYKIPNGIDVSLLRRIVSAHGEKLYDIACVARLSPEKGVQDLLSAVALVVRALPDIRVVIVGDGVMRRVLFDAAQRLKIERNVTWLGKLPHEETLRVFAQSLIAVVPSRAEGLGIVALEAMGLGIPVVATSVGGLPEIVRDGVTGILVSPRDPAALAAALQRLCGDARLRSTLGTAGATQSVLFDWNDIVQQYAVLYRKIIQTHAQ